VARNLQDIMVDGGSVVHIIDTVLTLPATAAETALDTGLTSLVGSVIRANGAQNLQLLTDITIFAPTNQAFSAIGSIANSASVQTLASVLEYHVILGAGMTTAISPFNSNPNQPLVHFSPELLQNNQVSFQTVNGANLTIRKQNGALFVNQARIIVSDILVANGVVHVIDG
jgi:uncharacterized surface protein with fasciclin (FAS1) repeats